MTSAVSAQVSAPCTMVTERPITSGSEYPLSLSQPTDAMRIRKGGSVATISWQRVWSRAPSAGGAGGAGGWLLGIGCLRPLASIMFHLTGILQPPPEPQGHTERWFCTARSSDTYISYAKQQYERTNE